MKKDCAKYGRWALICGSFLALLHLIWLICVGISASGMERILIWVLSLHHIQMSFSILPFNLAKAGALVLLTFVVGYLAGWFLCGLHYLLKK